jgi:PAS domain S-box-containing protein
MPSTPPRDELLKKINALEQEAADHAWADEKLFRLEQEKKAILDSMQEHVIYLDTHQRVVWANQAARKKAHMTDAELKGCNCYELWFREHKPCQGCPVTEALKSGAPAEIERSTQNGRKFLIKGYPVKNAEGRIVGALAMSTDITARIQAEAALKSSHRFLEIANRHTAMKPLLDEFVSEVLQITACEAVGIRVLETGGKIPYQSYQGFSKAFYESENALCIFSDTCMCVRVIKGKTKSHFPFYSEGSLLLNNTSAFLDSLPAIERQNMRNVCNRFGYQSVALVPIKLGQSVLGLIHVADRRPDMIPEDRVKQLEGTAMQLGAAMTRIKAEEAQRRVYEGLEVRVKERTAELTMANAQLRQEIEDRKRTEAALKLNEARLEALHTLSQMGEATLKEICDFVVEEGVKLTQSVYGYLFFTSADEKVLTVHAWSGAAMAICTVPGQPEIYQVKHTGLWGEAVRQRKPIITNDYSAPNPYTKGTPDGHVPIQRHMNIPVFEGSRIVAVAGVANKEEDYVETDVRQLQLLMKSMWRHIQRKRAQEALEESESTLRFLTTRLLNAQEKERKRVSNELHDELGQALLTLKLQLRALQRRLRDDQKEIKSDFEHIFKHINMVTENVRRLSKDLSPSILEDLGLVAAINWLAKSTGKRHYIDISCDVGDLHGLLDQEAELLLFRVVQEALTNMIKHARTRQASILALKDRDGVSVTIADMGVGFDVDSVLARKTPERGLGLAAMDERVRMLGGKLDLQSSLGSGTQLCLKIATKSDSPVPKIQMPGEAKTIRD